MLRTEALPTLLAKDMLLLRGLNGSYREVEDAVGRPGRRRVYGRECVVVNARSGELQARLSFPRDNNWPEGQNVRENAKRSIKNMFWLGSRLLVVYTSSDIKCPVIAEMFNFE